MKTILDELTTHGYLFKKFEPIETKALKIRNKIVIFHALSMKSDYILIIGIDQKSRILRKDVDKMEAIVHKAEHYVDHGFKQKILLIKAPLCSKAAAYFEQLGWKLHVSV
jgi:hypothetical protein